MIRFIFKHLTWIPFRLVFWTRVHNKREFRKLKKQGVVLVANHRSNTDCLPIFYGLPRPMHVPAKASIVKNRIIAYWARKLLVFPIEKGKEISVMKYSLKVLKNREALLIFPEGTRVFNPEEALALRNGASMIAIRAGVPVLPIVLSRAPRPFRLTRIKIGKPISTAEFEGRADKDQLTEFSNKISNTMREMLDGFEVKPKRRSWERLPLATARALVIREHNGVREILLVKRSRPDYRENRTYYVTPGGHIEDDETPRVAVIREIFEETGLTVNPLRTIYKWKKENRYKNKSEVHALWTCEYLGGEIDINPDSEDCKKYAEVGEMFEPLWVNLNDIRDPEFDLKPATFKRQLLIDLDHYGIRMVRRTKFLTDGK